MAKVSTDLGITFGGLKFKSPIGVGAVGAPCGKRDKITAEMHAEVLLKHAEAGASYIQIANFTYATEKTLRKIEEHAKQAPPEARILPPNMRPGSRIMGAYGAHHELEGLYVLLGQRTTPETAKAVPAQELVKIVKKRKPADVRIIINLLGFGELPDSWVDGAKKAEELGADMIELNLSCPMHPALRDAVDDFEQQRFEARFYGGIIGEMPDIIENLTREVSKAVSIPVGVKLSPETGMLRVAGLAKRVRDAGGKFVTSVNCGITIAPPDIYNRGKSIWPSADGGAFVGTSGPWLRHNCYRDVAAIARFAPGIDIAASGGLMTPQNCVEALMLGARQVQLCTGVMIEGRNFIRRCDSFLKKFIIEQGYGSVEEIVGLAQQHIKYVDDVNYSVKYVSATDDTKCTKCGVCADNICVARSMEDGEAKVNEDLCNGCGACLVCCSADAIKLVEVT